MCFYGTSSDELQIHLLTLILLELLTFFLLPTHQLWLCSIFSLFPQLYSAFIISPFAACSTQLPLHLAVWLPLIFPLYPCPLSLSVALLPNWLCNPEWISVSYCYWLKPCVHVHVPVHPCAWIYMHVSVSMVAGQMQMPNWLLTPELLMWAFRS